MPVNGSATPTKEQLSGPISFRHYRTRVEILDAFRRADGHKTLTPILREAVDTYIDMRMARARGAGKHGQ